MINYNTLGIDTYLPVSINGEVEFQFELRFVRGSETRTSTRTVKKGAGNHSISLSFDYLDLSDYRLFPNVELWVRARKPNTLNTGDFSISSYRRFYTTFYK